MENIMQLVAITGMPGSGKSLVRSLFSDLGVPTFDADAHARACLAPGEPLTQQVLVHCPACANTDGTINRKVLAEYIFADKNLRDWLEALIHPVVRQRLSAWAASEQHHLYGVAELPVLTAKNQPPGITRICVVDAPEAVCRQRVLARDQRSGAQISALFAAQQSRADRLAWADDILHNTGSLQDCKRQVLALHAQYCQLQP